jgi:hypothetical protein
MPARRGEIAARGQAAAGASTNLRATETQPRPPPIYDVAAVQTVHARKSYEHFEIRFGHCSADILDTQDDGRLCLDRQVPPAQAATGHR